MNYYELRRLMPKHQYHSNTLIPIETHKNLHRSVDMHDNICGSSSVGRASASQAEGRGFESRLPLYESQ